GKAGRSGKAWGRVERRVREVEGPFAGPLKVVEPQDEGPPFRHCLEEAPPCGEGLAPTISAELDGLTEADERLEMSTDSVGLGLVFDELTHGYAQLALHLLSGICLEHAGLRLDDLIQRPVRHGFLGP